MTDMNRLKQAIADSGITMIALANKSKIRRETLYNRLNGIGEFTASEISGLCEALRLKHSERENIFFAKEVE